MEKGLVLLAIVVCLLTPSLVAGDFKMKIWTDKTSYHVGEMWATVSWNSTTVTCGGAAKSPSGSLQINGPSTHTSEAIWAEKLSLGAYTPSVGRPWVAADVGSWTVALSTTSLGNKCDYSGTTTFQVIG
jgi:hypothetical protein